MTNQYQESRTKLMEWFQGADDNMRMAAIAAYAGMLDHMIQIDKKLKHKANAEKFIDASQSLETES